MTAAPRTLTHKEQRWLLAIGPVSVACLFKPVSSLPVSSNKKGVSLKKPVLYTKLSKANSGVILYPSWGTGSWAVRKAQEVGKRIGQELICESDGEEVWASFSVLSLQRC